MAALPLAGSVWPPVAIMPLLGFQDPLPTVQESLCETRLVRWLSMLSPQPLGSAPVLRARATFAAKPVVNVVALVCDVLLDVGLLRLNHEGKV